MGSVQRVNAQGDLAEASTQLSVSVKPGWKKGTKVTFPGEGDEGPGLQPADVVMVVAERLAARLGMKSRFGTKLGRGFI